MKKEKLSLSKLKINSFVTEVPANNKVKGGTGATNPQDTACLNSFGGPNSTCDTNKTLCPVEASNISACDCNQTAGWCPTRVPC